jgi:hypothetical protein
MPRYDILFAIIALREVRFFGSAATRFREEGLSVAFITFHEAGDALLERMGFEYFSLQKLKPRYLREWEGTSEADLEKRFGDTNLDGLIRHEMLTTNRTDRAKHLHKVAAYSALLSDILTANDVRCVVQELGGFIAPLCLYYMARASHVPHVFIEPSVFHRHLIFTLNDIYSDLPASLTPPDRPDQKLKDYVAAYRDRGVLVMPHKDKHVFYSMALSRIFSADNVRRLGRKLYHKYVSGHVEEYDAIGWYVINHLMKWFRSKRLVQFYREPRPGERYVFYPFHVPLDFQLTVRCPEFLDQIALVERIAASLPEGICLYIKEHPASIGALSVGRLRRALARRNVRLISPKQSAFDLIRHAEAVVSVNSKVGMEALMQNKPVLVLGQTYYRDKGVTVDWDQRSELSLALGEVLAYRPDPQAVEQFLARVWKWSYPGELYEFSPSNVEEFYASLRSFLGSHALCQLS